MENLDEITLKMMEYVCDNICKFPGAVGDREVMEEICEECRMREYVNELD